MAVFVAGLVGIIIFYLAILGVGVWASRKAKNNSEEELMLAGRSLGFVVGALTLIGKSGIMVFLNTITMSKVIKYTFF